MRENALIDKSIIFAARIIKLHRYLIKTKMLIGLKQLEIIAHALGPL